MQKTRVHPWIGKIPWTRKWQIPVLAWSIPWTEEPAGYRPWVAKSPTQLSNSTGTHPCICICTGELLCCRAETIKTQHCKATILQQKFLKIKNKSRVGHLPTITGMSIINTHVPLESLSQLFHKLQLPLPHW